MSKTRSAKDSPQLRQQVLQSKAKPVLNQKQSDSSLEVGEKMAGNEIDRSPSNGTPRQSHQVVPMNNIPVNNVEVVGNVPSRSSMIGERVRENVLAQIGPIIANSVKEILEDDSILESGCQTIATMRRNHQVDLDELERVYKISMSQQRAAVECEHQLELQELRTQIREAKRKTWCTICSNEANYYCCWNTAYCNTTCQQAHWLSHRTKCTHQSLSSSDESQAVNVPIIKRVMPKLVCQMP